MVSEQRVALILGAGPNIGEAVATKFALNGYKVALVGRSMDGRHSTASHLRVSGDLSRPENVETIFTQVKETLGIPSVVVYNGNSLGSSETF